MGWGLGFLDFRSLENPATRNRAYFHLEEHINAIGALVTLVPSLLDLDLLAQHNSFMRSHGKTIIMRSPGR